MSLRAVTTTAIKQSNLLTNDYVSYRSALLDMLDMTGTMSHVTRC